MPIDCHNRAADPLPYLLHAGQTQPDFDGQSLRWRFALDNQFDVVCLSASWHGLPPLRKRPPNNPFGHHQGLAQFRDLGISEPASIFQLVAESLLGDAQALGDIVFAESALVDKCLK